MKDIKEKISIIMPAYNEAGHIASSIEETAAAFNNFGYHWELIVMDDGSTDDTYKNAIALAQKYPQLIVRRNPVNTGKGRAIKKALHYITGEYTLFLDADMDLHPLQFQTLFDIMRLDKADIVIGSKLHPNSVVNYPLQRRIISFVYYLLVRALFNLPCHDTQTGLKLFKTEVLRNVLPKVLVKQFAFDLEVLVNAHHLGYKIAEAPIVLKPQRHYGRIDLRAIFTTGWDTLAVFYRMHILKYYDRIDYYRRKDLAE
ncbi:MAG: glycosyltransferase [Candidatus Omnitrophica bacterium]|nr:glycosyltransferase [Candidatus Omnitrophota bacterium]MBU4346915.1 glycosyltransferase [Candidatus Omnitrophota bacterium]MBU4473192.1 glycosyltransferase [Candidatus Omnitrophota bacterium]MCG2706380.1 glycosyltransferase [Candidatus Omnitrophota bacterium]